MTETRIYSILLIVILVIISVLFQGFIIPYHDISSDEGFLAYSGYRISIDQLHHRDFQTSYTGGVFFLFHILFSYCGVELLVLRYSLIPVGVINALLCFYFAYLNLLKEIAPSETRGHSQYNIFDSCYN